MNKTWHRAHILRSGASMDERIKWHVAHAKACACREIPKSVREAIAARDEQAARER
ncbi:MAG TPA: hypothetical protein VH419_07120 [Nocardioidaceae bacterium]